MRMDTDFPGDQIFIDDLQVQALIGVYDFERLAPQPLRFDVRIALDNRPAGASDALADTIDYAAVAERITTLCAQSRYQLVEALVEHIAARLLAEFPMQAIGLRVTKPNAVPAARGGVGVQITRQRERA
jgi:7,8-dihydroneopterin aldolase/epimerase/oxygenase